MPEASHPEDPVAGRSGHTQILLQELTDGEVADYCDYWAARLQHYRIEKNGFSAWWASKVLSTGEHESRQRGLPTTARLTRSGPISPASIDQSQVGFDLD